MGENVRRGVKSQGCRRQSAGGGGGGAVEGAVAGWCSRAATSRGTSELQSLEQSRTQRAFMGHSM